MLTYFAKLNFFKRDSKFTARYGNDILDKLNFGSWLACLAWYSPLSIRRV